MNVRLRRLLAEERKSLQQVRQNYAAELKVRTDMEMLLRQCVEDVRQEIARRHVESAQFSHNSGNDLAKLYSKQPGLIPADEFTQEDRERVLELLLSQERVVSLVYAKTFPVVVSNKQSGHQLGGDGGGNGSLDLGALLNDSNMGGHDLSSPQLNRNSANSHDPTAGDTSRPHTASQAVQGDGRTSKLPLLNAARMSSR